MRHSTVNCAHIKQRAFREGADRVRVLLLVLAIVSCATYALASDAVSARADRGAEAAISLDADGKNATQGLGLQSNDTSVSDQAHLSAISPPTRPGNLPRTQFQHMQGHALWTRSALSALKGHGAPLVDTVPADIAQWCPAYPTADDAARRAFWVGFMSALSKYESTYKARAVGGGGRWFGLLQILPATARGYKCNVGTGEGLRNGAANLSCAARIMAVTVPRDGVIYGRGGRGVAADWGPMRSVAKREAMAGWLRRQNYCKPIGASRPKARP